MAVFGRLCVGKADCGRSLNMLDLGRCDSTCALNPLAQRTVGCAAILMQCLLLWGLAIFVAVHANIRACDLRPRL